MPSARFALFTNGSRMTEDKLIWCKNQKIHFINKSPRIKNLCHPDRHSADLCENLFLHRQYRRTGETVKAEINVLPDGGIPRWFVDEMLCECRLQPNELVKAFGGNESRPCTAGKTFGVIGPSGYFRKCLHTIENIEWR